MSLPVAMIYVADDDPVVLRGVDRALRSRGYDVRTAPSGARLLSLIEERCPDLVILDIMMPGMSGLEVLRAMRADGRWPDLPVVVLTALGDPRVSASARRSGACTVMNKPFRLGELVRSVQDCMRGDPMAPASGSPSA